MPAKHTLKANGDLRNLDLQPDITDLRDRIYTPALVPLSQSVVPEIAPSSIRNQRNEGACTGFALAAVIDQQCKLLFGENSDKKVSTRMLYEMAKLHDDTPGRDHSGSTIRGALKGFFHNGVCEEKDAQFFPQSGPFSWELSIDLAKKARAISLGSYFRLQHEINDYHTALHEAGAIIASADLHSGWQMPKDGVIEMSGRHEGRHAFAIVGYTQDGFVIQNSWGKNWGDTGTALWTYEDWAENVVDAWVLRLGISSPRAFSIKYARNHALIRKQKPGSSALAPRRQDIHGHFIHMDDGALVSRGRYASTAESMDITTRHLQKAAADPESKFRHVLFFAHGAMQNTFDVARRIQAWKPVFKRNGIYPIHFMWETSFNNEVSNVICDLLQKSRARMGTTKIDEGLEALARPLGRKLWRDLKLGASLSFAEGSEVGVIADELLRIAQDKQGNGLKLHFASQSAGVFLLSSLLPRLEKTGRQLETCSLMAPACSVDHYDVHLRDHVGGIIKQIDQYTLIDSRERADAVDIYGKSLLYLVSNAIEDEPGAKMLGMQKFLDQEDAIQTLPAKHKVHFAGRDRAVTDAKSHRGFDADIKTMNHMLESILGQDLARSDLFSSRDLFGY